MSITITATTPTDIRYFPEADDVAQHMTEQSINDIIEIFNTPLQGSYNWDYSSIDGRIRKLYRLGKELNWNQEFDLDWSQEFSQDQYPMNESFNPLRVMLPLKI